MPSWKIHDKWAKKMGIAKEVSDYINRAIDNIDMPEDFRKHTDQRKLPRSRGGSTSIADIVAGTGRNEHDRARSKLIKKQDLLFLLPKGKDYIKAWYLHFILDYLVKLRDWRKNTGESIEECIDKYKRNKKAVVTSGTEEVLTEVMDFLKKNSQELQQDIDLW